LQREWAILSADVRAKKQAEFQAKTQAFQKKVQERETEINNGTTKAQQQVDQALGPIIQQIMKERGATILIDRGAILMATDNIDISTETIQRLDKALTTVKVELVKSSDNAQATTGQQK
jgi:Skp family chaperone for outer membrane proteins